MWLSIWGVIHSLYGIDFGTPVESVVINLENAKINSRTIIAFYVHSAYFNYGCSEADYKILKSHMEKLSRTKYFLQNLFCNYYYYPKTSVEYHYNKKNYTRNP